MMYHQAPSPEEAHKLTVAYNAGLERAATLLEYRAAAHGVAGGSVCDKPLYAAASECRKLKLEDATHVLPSNLHHARDTNPYKVPRWLIAVICAGLIIIMTAGLMT